MPAIHISSMRKGTKSMTFSISRPNMSRRRFLETSAVTVGSAMGAGLLLDACNTSTSSTPTGSSKTTVTVMYASNEFTKAYVSEFEKLNPDLTISFIEFDQTRLDAMMAANTPPDFVRGTGVGSANYSARGLALNLDPYLAKSTVLKASDLVDANNTWRWNGKQTGSGSYYGIAKDWSQDAMLWVNDAVFEKANVAPLSSTTPTTFDNLMEIAKKITVRQGGKIQTYGIDPSWVYCNGVINQMIQQQGGQYFNSDLSQIDYTTTEGKNAIQWYVDFAKAHVGFSPFDPDADGAGNDTPSYLANRLGIVVDGYWFGGNVSTATDALKAKSRLLPAPQMGSNRVSACFSATGAWIPATSKNKDAAWKVMEYFIGGTPAHDRAASGWGLPSLKSLLNDVPQKLAYQQEAYTVAQDELSHLSIQPDSPYITGTTLNTLFDKYMQQAVKGQITVSSAAEKITADANQHIQQTKQQLS
jgi:multiple sugar transport system substrate-binding protein